MISIFHDLPFRKDLLKKIIQDFQNKSGNLSLNPEQIAGLCDLMGLSTSLIDHEKGSFNNLKLPSLLIENNTH